MPGAHPIDSTATASRTRSTSARRDTSPTNPACNGSVLPLPTTNNQTIFHVLDKGETGTNSLEIGFRVQNADVYFLMDMSDTMARRARQPDRRR